MPRVRIYDDDMVAPARTTDARFVAADNGGGVGGGLGAGLVGAGGALAHHADVMEDIRRARAAELEAVLQHQAIRAEVARRKGLSAEEATAAAHQAIGKTRNDVLARAASPRIRDMLSDVLDQREETLRHELDAHVEREKSAAHIGSALRRQALAQQDAVVAATPLAFHTHVRTMLDAADEHAALTGRDPGETGADKFRALSAVHANRIGALLHDGDVEGAAAWHAAHEQALSGPDNAKARAALAEPVARTASQARVDGLMGARTRDGDAPFSYADPLHGAGKTPVPRGDGGIHIPAHPGTPAYPSAAGIATLDGAGITVTHADGSQTKYAGLGEARVKDGDKVTPDTILGTVAGAQGAEAGLRYAVLQDGAPADPASAIDRLAHEPGRHDVQALMDAIANHPDPEYAQEDRARDMAEVWRRADLAEALARPQQQQMADARTGATQLGEESASSGRGFGPGSHSVRHMPAGAGAAMPAAEARKRSVRAQASGNSSRMAGQQRGADNGHGRATISGGGVEKSFGGPNADPQATTVELAAGLVKNAEFTYNLLTESEWGRDAAIFDMVDEALADPELSALQLYLFRAGLEELKGDPTHGEVFGEKLKLLDGLIYDRQIADPRETITVRGSLPRKELLKNGGVGGSIRLKPGSMKNAAPPAYEIGYLSTVRKYDDTIVEMSQKYNVDPDLIRSIMYMETTHGYYDVLYESVDRNSSSRPMNINTDYWGDAWGTRKSLKVPRNSIEAGTKLLKAITTAMPRSTIDEIATIYNDTNATTVNTYGARVQAIYYEKPWFRK